MTKTQDPAPTGVQINLSPKLLAIVVLICSGAGGLGVSNMFLVGDSAADTKSHKSDNIDRDQKLNTRIEKVETAVISNTTSIKTVSRKVDSINETQNGDIARTEARRVTAGIKDRGRREREYDRLVLRNKYRLKNGDPPCQDLTCVE